MTPLPQVRPKPSLSRRIKANGLAVALQPGHLLPFSSLISHQARLTYLPIMAGFKLQGDVELHTQFLKHSLTGSRWPCKQTPPQALGSAPSLCRPLPLRLSHFPVHLKPTQHGKSTLLQNLFKK